MDLLMKMWKIDEVLGLEDTRVPMAAVQLPRCNRVADSTTGAETISDFLSTIHSIQVRRWTQSTK